MDGQDGAKPYLPEEVNGDIRHEGKDDADAELIAAELRYIEKKKGAQRPHIAGLLARLRGERTPGETPYLFGLALSGGGIRSATFSLGVLQRLARARLLERVDYLSTVSGGGYIGSALSWWMSGQTGAPQELDLAENFPYGIRDPVKPKHNDKSILRYLRQSGQYLTPGAGITVWSGVAVVGRAVLLNLLVWVPVVAFLFLLIKWFGSLPFLSGLQSMVGMLAPDVIPTVARLVGTADTLSNHELLPPVFLLSLLLALLIAALFVLSSINYSVLAWMGRGEAAERALHHDGERKLKASIADLDFAESRGEWISLLRAIGRWLLVGGLGLLDLVVLFVLVQWLDSSVEPMFGDGGTPISVSGQLFAQWPRALAISAVIGLLIVYVAHRDDWPRSDLKGFINIFGGFVFLFVLDAILAWLIRAGVPPYWLWGAISLPWISGLLQLIAVVGLFVLVNFWVAYLIRWLLRTEALSVRYGGRRLFEQFFGTATLVSLALLALGAVPLIDAWIGQRVAGLEGAVSVAAGVASAIWGHLQSSSGKPGGPKTKLVLVGGSVLFLYGIALLGYRLAVTFDQADSLTRAGLAALFLLAVLTGWFTNINYISLHRFYRDRLMEAFMPDWETVEAGVAGPARRADDLRISDLWEHEQTKGPFHIVNTNLVLANSTVRKYRIRGGDNFILSPLYSGSAATGWQTSDTLVNGEMTLASAMATSGAAANPRGGPGGRGLTRNRFVSLLMTLLSFRLGYWIARPTDQKILFKRPNHFRPSGYYSLFKAGYRETSSLLELSDGGHFENLAIYELVRRRCGLIIVCDGGQDNESSYADFVTAIQRIGQDFGATVYFDVEVAGPEAGKFTRSGPEALIARPTDDKYPKNAEYAEKGYFLATIDYGRRGGGAWPDKGTVIYLKAAMIEALSMTAKGYKGANPDFPNQTTADQFFDEEQFEAYRELGYRIAEQMIDDLGLDTLFRDRPAYELLRKNDRFRANDS
jgi:predicted acylesterase/phospholipase RssA